MANGFLIAAESDVAAIGELGDGFGLGIIAVNASTDLDAVSATLTSAANVGIVLSEAAAGDSVFVALLQMLAERLKSPQLILVEPDALRAFAFLPALWPTMLIEDARARALALIQSRAPQAAAPEPPGQEHEDIPEPAPVIEESGAPLTAEADEDVLADKLEEESAPETFQAEAPPSPAPVIAEEQDAPLAEPAPVDEAPQLVIAEDVERAITLAPPEQETPEAPPFLAEPEHEAAPAPQPAAPAPVIAPFPAVLPPGTVLSAPNDGPSFGGGVAPVEPEGHEPAPLAAREEPLRAASAEPRPEPDTPALDLPEFLRRQSGGHSIANNTAAGEPPATLDQRYGDMTEAMGGAAQEEAPEAPETPAPPDLAQLDAELGRLVESRKREGARAEDDEGPRRVGASEPAPASRPAPAAPAPQAARKREAEAQPTTAPADATAFAPKKLRRGEAELVRISIHQPKDLQAVIKAARKADPRTTGAPQSMGIGDVALGAKIGVALEVKGAPCDGSLHRRTWTGAPLDFSFAVTPDADVKQVVIMARVFVDDAQIGVLAFTREVTGPRPKALPDGERIRLKRHKRVFLSYSSKDRETVSAIATAYQMAGVEHFWDRTSLTGGEEWNPRLRREIDRSDLFHLCWSKHAAHSPWVKEEAVHALTRKRRVKKPEITVQMLDGPPWAPHPPELDAINFDDFVRAAIVGYARGEG